MRILMSAPRPPSPTASGPTRMGTSRRQARSHSASDPWVRRVWGASCGSAPRWPTSSWPATTRRASGPQRGNDA
eukprot:13788438-Alexandrium_andersonii.AAC.1